MEQCKTHDQQIMEIRTEFDQYKKYTNEKMDEILARLKPQFSPIQVMTFLFSIVITIGSIIVYVESIKSDTRNNTTEINGLKKIGDISEMRYDMILVKLNEIDKKVDITAVKMDQETIRNSK